jgi:4-hydroxy-3-methylbut-2-enyl diphosphate reductase
MKILRAVHLGMCFGVRDAIALAEQHSQQHPLTILGDLVHNETVLADLRARGIRIAREAGEVNTPHVMITAHGASQKAIAGARAHGLDVLEATCPLVLVAHRAITNLVKDGYYPVIIGQREHVEVRGLTGDLDEFSVVLCEADIANLPNRQKLGIAAQTTQPIEKALRLVESIRRRYPNTELRFVDTVCQPTKQRQTAASDLARRSDVVIVIGGARSNNTHELAQTCTRFCDRVHHVQNVSELRESWFKGATTVGVTAGTSTPDSVINAVEEWLERLTARNEEHREAA